VTRCLSWLRWENDRMAAHDRGGFGCGYCADDQNRLYGHLDQLDSDETRQMILLRCPRCGTYYENTPRGEDKTRRLTPEEADHLYPGHPH
jgi:hypothetical protein